MLIHQKKAVFFKIFQKLFPAGISRIFKNIRPFYFLQKYAFAVFAKIGLNF